MPITGLKQLTLFLILLLTQIKTSPKHQEDSSTSSTSSTSSSSEDSDDERQMEASTSSYSHRSSVKTIQWNTVLIQHRIDLFQAKIAKVNDLITFLKARAQLQPENAQLATEIKKNEDINKENSKIFEKAKLMKKQYLEKKKQQYLSKQSSKGQKRKLQSSDEQKRKKSQRLLRSRTKQTSFQGPRTSSPIPKLQPQPSLPSTSTAPSMSVYPQQPSSSTRILTPQTFISNQPSSFLLDSALRQIQASSSIQQCIQLHQTQIKKIKTLQQQFRQNIQNIKQTTYKSTQSLSYLRIITFRENMYSFMFRLLLGFLRMQQAIMKQKLMYCSGSTPLQTKNIQQKSSALLQIVKQFQKQVQSACKQHGYLLLHERTASLPKSRKKTIMPLQNQLATSLENLKIIQGDEIYTSNKQIKSNFVGAAVKPEILIAQLTRHKKLFKDKQSAINGFQDKSTTIMMKIQNLFTQGAVLESSYPLLDCLIQRQRIIYSINNIYQYLQILTNELKSIANTVKKEIQSTGTSPISNILLQQMIEFWEKVKVLSNKVINLKKKLIMIVDE